ncbi:hypothetical protein [Dehalogenimonas alkenigignens]|uniref:Uncharacterized protein n=1 Tax=Dehalogenimonas alkenigignens TaxID=1217799 RepID=A0A0W0GGC8_9CHLR|nr:hypothetical protein [Dehalogenimonas alkenigignens]KTB47595.1 hypothetical protein DEALK_04400 [Dehalogenimonas alkenigignens]PVV82863.1 hypothetical protein DD509_07690 [Dehalogenimonas alkenigignens]
MRTADEPIVVESLGRLNEYGADDLLICCASFEDRSISAVERLSGNFRVRYSIIFVIEESRYQPAIDANLLKIQSVLSRKTSEGVFVIRCQREDPVEGINQLKAIWKRCRPKDIEEPFITLDISGFSKVYLLGLLHYLVAELNMGLPRIIHTTQTYAPSRLTQGVHQITTIANFFGSFSIEKETVLVLFLGFEAERSLSVWKQFNPVRTICLITTPRDGNDEYVRYAEKNNEVLLAQPNVEIRQVAADSPYHIRNTLESIYEEFKTTANMIIGPFGTKPQTVGIFVFWLEHPRVQVVYSFPSEYTKSYLNRKPGRTIMLPLSNVTRGTIEPRF